MLTYEEFKAEILDSIVERLGEGSEDYVVKDISVEKRGHTLDGFCIRASANSNIAPTFYYESLYELYERVGSVDGVFDELIPAVKDAFERCPIVKPRLDPDAVRKQVVFEVVNSTAGERMAPTAPHRQMFGDFYVFYRWIVKVDDDGVYSGLVTNDLLSALGMTEEELYGCAVKNTPKMNKPQFTTFYKSLFKMLKSQGMSERAVRAYLENGKEFVERIFVVGNKRNFNGASYILTPEVMERVAEKIGGDFYISLTGVDGLMCFPTDDRKLIDGLCQIVKEVSRDLRDVGEGVLSDKVFFYHDGEISVVDEQAA